MFPNLLDYSYFQLEKPRQTGMWYLYRREEEVEEKNPCETGLPHPGTHLLPHFSLWFGHQLGNKLSYKFLTPFLLLQSTSTRQSNVTLESEIGANDELSLPFV